MVGQCPQCHRKQHSIDNYTCEFCKAELIDNGQLIDSLTFWDAKKPAAMLRNIIPLGIIAVAGVASAALNSYLILIAGIAAAAIYYFKPNKQQNLR